MTVDETTSRLLEMLRSYGTVFAPGLTQSEVVGIEQRYDFIFPPDLRALLQQALPISRAFPNWRDAPETVIRERLEWPLDGICFDFERNAFWLNEWGERPVDSEEARRIASQHVRSAPTLIPICSHRYMPSEPKQPGTPVFSVYQTDVIYYGYDLESYFATEFKRGEPLPNDYVISPDGAAKIPRQIRFWDTIIDANGYVREHQVHEDNDVRIGIKQDIPSTD